MPVWPLFQVTVTDARLILTTRVQQNKTNKNVMSASKDSDQHGHPTGLIRVFAVRIEKS